MDPEADVMRTLQLVMLICPQVFALETGVDGLFEISDGVLDCIPDPQTMILARRMNCWLRWLVGSGLVAAVTRICSTWFLKKMGKVAAAEKAKRLAVENRIHALENDIAQESASCVEKKNVKRIMTESELVKARKAWDNAIMIGTKPKAGTMPRPADGPQKAWDIEGYNVLSSNYEAPSFLTERSADVIARCIDRDPKAFVSWCEGLSTDFLICIFERLNWVSLATMHVSGRFDEVGSISSNNQLENWLSQDKHHRRLYAATKHNNFLIATARGVHAKAVDLSVPPLVLNPHLGLVDVLENATCFDHQAWDAEEEATPKLFEFSSTRPSGRAVVDREKFHQQFDVFCMGQLANLDWRNVCAAGGSVLAAVNHPPPGSTAAKFYNSPNYRSSDVDLFLYGLDEGAANEKVKQIYSGIKQANPQVFAVRSQRTVTIVSEFPYRKIQIILRLYKTLAEVLHGFDVDACSVGFDGKTVWATNRAARAICKRYNVVDITRRSPSYESRLFKYGKRGHPLLVKGMEVDKLNPSLSKFADAKDSPLSSESPKIVENGGLAKLLLMDSCYHRYLLGDWGHAYEKWKEGNLFGPPEEADGVKPPRRFHSESDYAFMVIAYGPGKTWRVARYGVNRYIEQANTWYCRQSKGADQVSEPCIQPIMCGRIEQVMSIATSILSDTEKKEALALQPTRGWYSKYSTHSLSPKHDEVALSHMRHVMGDVIWLKENPGQQDSLLTGSFRPMSSSERDWEKGAYK